jgi:hypothetical protein
MYKKDFTLASTLLSKLYARITGCELDQRKLPVLVLGVFSAVFLDKCDDTPEADAAAWARQLAPLNVDTEQCKAFQELFVVKYSAAELKFDVAKFPDVVGVSKVFASAKLKMQSAQMRHIVANYMVIVATGLHAFENIMELDRAITERFVLAEFPPQESKSKWIDFCSSVADAAYGKCPVHSPRWSGRCKLTLDHIRGWRPTLIWDCASAITTNVSLTMLITTGGRSNILTAAAMLVGVGEYIAGHIYRNAVRCSGAAEEASMPYLDMSKGSQRFHSLLTAHGVDNPASVSKLMGRIILSGDIAMTACLGGMLTPGMMSK